MDLILALVTIANGLVSLAGGCGLRVLLLFLYKIRPLSIYVLTLILILYIFKWHIIIVICSQIVHLLLIRLYSTLVKNMDFEV